MTEHLEPIHTSAFKSTKGTYHLLLMDILPSSYSVVKLLQKVKSRETFTKGKKMWRIPSETRYS